jgi:hypothetical protein
MKREFPKDHWTNNPGEGHVEVKTQGWGGGEAFYFDPSPTHSCGNIDAGCAFRIKGKIGTCVLDASDMVKLAIAILQHQGKIVYETDPFDLMFRGLNGIPTDEKGDYCRADIERLIVEVRQKC